MSNPLGEIIDEATVEEMESFTKNVLAELDYLRYFYQIADFGPADADVRAIMNDGYKKPIPEGYGDE